MQKHRLDKTGLAKPGEMHGLTGTGPGLDHQEAACLVFGWVWKRTELFFRSEPGPLAGYPDPLLSLVKCGSRRIEWVDVVALALQVPPKVNGSRITARNILPGLD